MGEIEDKIVNDMISSEDIQFEDVQFSGETYPSDATGSVLMGTASEAPGIRESIERSLAEKGVSEGDLLDLVMGISGGGIGKGLKSLKIGIRKLAKGPKDVTGAVPKTAYGNPGKLQDLPPGGRPGYYPTIEGSKKFIPRQERLFQELKNRDLDLVDFQKKLRELEGMDPELAGQIIEIFGI